MKTLAVAAVQVASENGADDANLARATVQVAVAAGRGAKLVLCPEFLAAGYVFDEVIRQSGEKRGGRTETWLSAMAARHSIYIGATYLEADGDDFYNTFTLMNPDGSVAGRVRKGSLPFFEGWYFRSSDDPKFIDTDIGRIGVGICNDNQTCRFRKEMQASQPELVLMPHSAPTPTVPLIQRWVRKTYFERLSQIASQYAQTLGVPIVMSNKAGNVGRTPIPTVPLVRISWVFEGYSTICNGGGRVVEQLALQEGVVFGEVSLERKATPVPAGDHFYWSYEPDRMSNPLAAMMLRYERKARKAYAANPRRKHAARAVAGL